MKKLLLSAMVVALTFAAPAAFAGDDYDGDKKRAGKHKKHHIDTNGDGVVSKSEFMKAQEKKFKELDANNDGKIEREEFKAFKGKMKKKREEWREKFKEKRAERKKNKESSSSDE